MSQPNQQELRDAFQAGFDSIDDGDGFYVGFHAFLEHHGYQLREDLPAPASTAAPTATNPNAAGPSKFGMWD